MWQTLHRLIHQCLQNRPIKEFQSNLKGILELLTRNANVTVLTIPPIMKFGKNQGSIKAANEVVKIEAANYPSIQKFSNKM